ncbi:MAG: SDR family NAD(P)-dependent oxidoreductase [Chloroflexi bacterium]|nr:SDR family NAD(P)-dependent oxidoreductase [Chloroflexota bacterium]
MERVVIVTGAGGVIGKEIATAFAKEGDKVVLNDIRMAPVAEQAVAINKGPGQAFPYQADVRNYEQVKAMVDETVRRWGRVDVVACVAGGSYGRVSGTNRQKLLVEYSDEDWDLVLDVNLKGPFHCIKAAAAPMMARKSGNIIMMGSRLGTKGKVGRANYASAKAGLYGLMKVAALELGPYNIKVNVVIPGHILHADEAPDDELMQQNTLGRTQTPSEVARFYVYLSRTENVSGQIFYLESRII